MNPSISCLRKGLLGLTIIGTSLLASSAKATDPIAAIAGRVFCDVNCNGIIDEGIDEQLMKVKVSLLDQNGNVLQVKTTGESGGIYLFTGLTAGMKYSVQVTAPYGQEVLQSFPSSNAIRVSKSRVSVIAVEGGITYYPNDFLLDCGSKTWNQYQWGTSGCGLNPIDLISNRFDDLFPNGLVIGGIKTITFTSAGKIVRFLPASGTPKKLTTSRVDPYSNAESEFAGNLLALVLNLKLSEEGITGEGLGDNYFESGPFKDMTLQEFSDLANRVLGGETNLLPSGTSISDMNRWIEYVNSRDWSDCGCGCDKDKDCGKDKGHGGHCDKDKDKNCNKNRGCKKSKGHNGNCDNGQGGGNGRGRGRGRGC